ncbi:MAG: matrixin family metalloprotease [Candidatus Bathyarchaeota archaeon]|nr:MAG: matrixin family metalloprotease [Candidatus Bathyarchaeota archaeon]
MLVLDFCGQTNAQSEHTIEIRGNTWSDTTFRVAIIPQENQSWWEPTYLDAALHGVAQWNDAIKDFSSQYPEFGYLSRITLIPIVTTEAVSGFDIYIGWIAECEMESTIGQTRLLANKPCTIINSTVCLAAKAPSGHVMTEIDMQNIVVHELGHTFGLGHCSYSEDAMYAVVQYRETVKPLSTLDLYAVSQIFVWMNVSAQFSSSSQCPEQSTLSLPSNIAYSNFQIAEENLPTYYPKGFIEKALELFLRPEILIVLTIGVMLLLGATVLSKKQESNHSANDQKL